MKRLAKKAAANKRYENSPLSSDLKQTDISEQQHKVLDKFLVLIKIIQA